MVCKRCLIGLQKGVNKTSKGHRLEAKRALIRVQLSLNKNRSGEKDFYEINERYFRAIYFSFAPLLCVPMYQQIRPQKDISYAKGTSPNPSEGGELPNGINMIILKYGETN